MSRESLVSKVAHLTLLSLFLASCSQSADELALREEILREAEVEVLRELEALGDELDVEDIESQFELRNRVFRSVFRDRDEDLSRQLRSYLSHLPEIDIEDIEDVCEKGVDVELPDQDGMPDPFSKVYPVSTCREVARRVAVETDEWNPSPYPALVLFRLSDDDDVLVAETVSAYLLISYEFDGRHGLLKTEDEVTMYVKERD